MFNEAVHRRKRNISSKLNVCLAERNYHLYSMPGSFDRSGVIKHVQYINILDLRSTVRKQAARWDGAQRRPRCA